MTRSPASFAILAGSTLLILSFSTACAAESSQRWSAALFESIWDTPLVKGSEEKTPPDEFRGPGVPKGESPDVADFSESGAPDGNSVDGVPEAGTYEESTQPGGPQVPQVPQVPPPEIGDWLASLEGVRFDPEALHPLEGGLSPSGLIAYVARTLGFSEFPENLQGMLEFSGDWIRPGSGLYQVGDILMFQLPNGWWQPGIVCDGARHEFVTVIKNKGGVRVVDLEDPFFSNNLRRVLRLFPRQSMNLVDSSQTGLPASSDSVHPSGFIGNDLPADPTRWEVERVGRLIISRIARPIRGLVGNAMGRLLAALTQDLRAERLMPYIRAYRELDVSGPDIEVVTDWMVSDLGRAVVDRWQGLLEGIESRWDLDPLQLDNIEPPRLRRLEDLAIALGLPSLWSRHESLAAELEAMILQALGAPVPEESTFQDRWLTPAGRAWLLLELDHRFSDIGDAQLEQVIAFLHEPAAVWFLGRMDREACYAVRRSVEGSLLRTGIGIDSP